MSPTLATIAYVGLLLGFGCTFAESNVDYRTSRMWTCALPTLALLIMVAIDFYGRVWS